MAIWYIDPTIEPAEESDSFDGGFGSGYLRDSWTDVTLESDSEYYMRSGASESLSSTIVFDSLTDVIIGNYGQGSRPTLSFNKVSVDRNEWSEIEPNVWAFDIPGGNGYESYVLGLGAPGASLNEMVSYSDSGGSQTNWREFGDFSFGRTTPRIYVYSDANPVDKWGAVYFGEAGDPAIRIKNCDRVTISELKFIHSPIGLIVTNQDTETVHGDINVYRIEADECHKGILLSSNKNNESIKLSNTTVSHCHFTRCGAAGIQYYGHFIHLRIHSNEITGCLRRETTASIYGSVLCDPGEEAWIFNNEVSGGGYGRYWAGDGDGIYTDNGSFGNRIFANYIHDLPDEDMSALRDNSGGDNQWWFGNLVSGAYLLCNIGDSQSYDNIGIMLCNNTGINLGNGINVISNADVGTIDIYNNILSITGGYGIRHIGGVNATINENLNCVHGAGSYDPVGPNSLTDDPLLDEHHQPALPALINAGHKWWSSGNRPIGYDNNPFPDFDISLGAIQSRDVPFSPSRL